MAQLTVRGQYRAGASDGGAVPGYLEELGSTTSKTETFVAIKAEIENWRWAGVPFYLRTGKRLPTRVSEIVVDLQADAAFDLRRGRRPDRTPTAWCIRLQPDEGVKLWLMIKDPGPGGMRLQHVPLDMSFAEAFDVRNPDAYERLLMDVVRGNQTLFMRRDEVEAAWAWIDPILEAWTASADAAQALYRRHLGAVRRRGADRARRAHLVRGSRPMIEAERIFAAREALAESLARDVAEELMRAIEAKGKATLAVSGGTTPKLSSTSCRRSICHGIA